MSSTFPINPENGDTYTAFGRTYEYSSLKSAWHPVSIAPKISEIVGVDQFTTPDVGDILVSDGTLLTTSTPNIPKTYQTISELPLSGNIIGNIAVVSANNRVYLWTGDGWFSVALINTSPTITVGPDATYELNSDGTPTVITLAAVDPEEVPITWTYSVTSGSLEDTVITNDGPEFTITPGLIAATFDLTFTASDGINLAQTPVSSFTLSFIPIWSSGGTLETVVTTNITNAYLYGAELNDDGTVAVVASTGDNSVSTFRVYTRSGSTWSLAYTPTPPNDGSSYGRKVSISGDGTTIAVSKSGDDVPGNNYGSFEIWTGSGSNWTLQTTKSYGAYSNEFAKDIQLSRDGQRILIRAQEPRFVMVYEKSGSNWNLLTSTSASYTFGTYESILYSAASSNLEVISCKIRDLANGNVKFHIYEWNGTSYQLVINQSGAAYSALGDTSAVSPDGEYVIFTDVGNVINTYVRNSALNWSLSPNVLNRSSTTNSLKFSSESTGGDFVIATSGAANISPQVYEFNRGSWGGSVTTLSFTGLQGTQTTSSGDISNNGKYIAVVNTGENRTGYNNSGAVYFFRAD